MMKERKTETTWNKEKRKIELCRVCIFKQGPLFFEKINICIKNIPREPQYFSYKTCIRRSRTDMKSFVFWFNQLYGKTWYETILLC